MPLWIGEVWKCGYCGWDNAEIRTKCRNIACTKTKADTEALTGECPVIEMHCCVVNEDGVAVPIAE